jgi:hypothetical protein
MSETTAVPKVLNIRQYGIPQGAGLPHGDLRPQLSMLKGKDLVCHCDAILRKARWG